MATQYDWQRYDSECDCDKEVDLTQYLGTYYYSGREPYSSLGGTNYPIYKLKNGLAEIHAHPYKTSSFVFSIEFYDPNDYDNNYGWWIASSLNPQYVDNNYIQIDPLNDNPFDGTEYNWATRTYPGGLVMKAVLNDNCLELGFDN